MTKSLCWKTPLATACPQALFTVIESSPSAEVWSSGRFEKQHHVVESTLTLEPDRRSLCSPMYSQSSFVHVENRDNNSNLKIYWNYLKGRITSSLQNEMFSIKEKSLLFFFFNHFPLHKWRQVHFCSLCNGSGLVSETIGADRWVRHLKFLEVVWRRTRTTIFKESSTILLLLMIQTIIDCWLNVKPLHLVMVTLLKPDFSVFISQKHNEKEGCLPCSQGHIEKSA